MVGAFPMLEGKPARQIQNKGLQAMVKAETRHRYGKEDGQRLIHVSMLILVKLGSFDHQGLAIDQQGTQVQV